MIKCPNCDTEVSPGEKFCGECGAPLESAEPTSSPSPPPLPSSPPQPGQFPWTPVFIGGGIVVVLACLCLLCLGGGLLAFIQSGEWTTEVAVIAGTPETVSQPRKSGTLNLRGQAPVTLDPALAGDSNSTEYIMKIFSGLVSLEEDLEIRPELAKEWDISEDGTVYTFYLREEAIFHNGKPVTADDVKYSIERACDPETGSTVASSYLGDIVGALDKLNGKADEVEGVEVVDEYTVQITIDAPKSYFLSKLTYHTAFVLDKENVEKGGENWTEKPNGTGPFKLKKQSKDEIVLEAHQDYYYGAPAIKEVNFIIEGGSSMTMYEQGELDVTVVGPIDIERVTDPSNPLNKELTIVPSLDVWYLAFNTEMPPFDDVKIRQAFAQATNKKGIVNVLLQKTVREAKGILPPGMPGYNEDLEGLPFDPDRARELIEDSEYGDAAELPPIIFTVSGEGGSDPLAEALIEMYREYLGVELELEQVEFGSFLGDLEQHKYQMFMLGWTADYPDPEDFLDILFHSKSQYNNTAYSNPKVDELLEKARLETDEKKRWQLYQQAEEIMVEEAPWVPIYHSVSYVLTKPYVKDLSVTPQGNYYIREAYLESD